MALSENVVYPEKSNGFADHYPYTKWLFHWGYTPFSDIPTCENRVYSQFSIPNYSHLIGIMIINHWVQWGTNHIVYP